MADANVYEVKSVAVRQHDVDRQLAAGKELWLDLKGQGLTIERLPMWLAQKASRIVINGRLVKSRDGRV